MHIWQTFNALFVVRCIVKYLIETGTEYQLLQHFEAMPSVAVPLSSNGSVTIETGDAAAAIRPMPIVDGSKFESFFDAIVNLLVIIPVK